MTDLATEPTGIGGLGPPPDRTERARAHRDPNVSSRGQTEPLAALVSVAAICIAISVYAGVASTVLPDLGGEREIESATIDRLWTELSTDGVVEIEESGLGHHIETDALPRGYRVAVTVTVVDGDGHLDAVGEETFDTDGNPARLEAPDTASTATRPVPVQVDDADIRPGRLTVVVWRG